MRLNGRTAIVTGGDSGIGAATAAALAEEGADVAVTFLHDADGAERTRRMVEAAGRRGLAVRADGRDTAAVARLFERVAAELAPPDLLVNAAGVGQGGEPVADMPTERWEEVIRADLSGPFFCCREFVRLRRGRSAIRGRGPRR